MDTQATDPSRLALLPLLDESSIAALRDPELGGDPEFLAEVVEAFLGDSPPRIAAIRASLASGDADAVSRAAHSLKGSSSNFGALRMQTLCADIERLGRSGQLGPLPQLATQLGIEYRQVAERLSELVAASAGQPAATS